MVETLIAGLLVVVWLLSATASIWWNYKWGALDTDLPSNWLLTGLFVLLCIFGGPLVLAVMVIVDLLCRADERAEAKNGRR